MNWRHMRYARWTAVALAAGQSLAACGASSPILDVATLAAPVGDSIAVPQLSPVGNGRMIASWLAPQPTGGYAFRFAEGGRDGWSAPQTVVTDDSVFMHPTDLPSVLQLSTDTLAAVWQRKVNKSTSGDAWQYEFRVQFSGNSGATWTAPVIPHPGSMRGGEHEFHSAWPAANGRLGLAWIDPRDQTVVPPSGTATEAQFLGAMQLMTSEISPDGQVRGEQVIDDVICECCPTAVAVAGGAPLLAYRDKRVPPDIARDSLRYEMEVLRDFSLARRLPSTVDGPVRWEAGQRVTDDNWLYSGCPNNGAALSAHGDTVVLAWWTGEGETPRVQLRWSDDGGRTFGDPRVVSEAHADGQVSVAISSDATYVAWLQDNSIVVRSIDRAGVASAVTTLGRVQGRHRLPTMIPDVRGGVMIGWLGVGSRWELRHVQRRAP